MMMSKDNSGSATVHQQVAAVSDKGHKDNDRCDWKPRGGKEGRLLLPTLGHRGCLQVLLTKAILKNLMLGFSGTSMEKFSKSERNWIQAWGCAILKQMDKNLIVKVSTLFSSWDLVGLRFVYIPIKEELLLLSLTSYLLFSCRIHVLL